jgi:hypothetical protein
MRACITRVEGDETACACGLRWFTKDDPPQCPHKRVTSSYANAPVCPDCQGAGGKVSDKIEEDGSPITELCKDCNGIGKMTRASQYYALKAQHGSLYHVERKGMEYRIYAGKSRRILDPFNSLAKAEAVARELQAAFEEGLYAGFKGGVK